MPKVSYESLVAFGTRLLVRAPDKPLPLNNKPITVNARVQDPNSYISHVELYAVEMPGNTNVLLDSQVAPFEQTVFTASPSFTPSVPGDYVIKVVGYNKNGDSRESEYIRFTVQ